MLRVTKKMLPSDYMPSEGYHLVMAKLCVVSRSEEKVIFSLVSFPMKVKQGIDDTDDFE